MKFFSQIRLLLAGIWLGAAIFFIFVAQSSFAVLPQRELAGAVVNRTLALINYSGLAISVLMLLTTLIGQSITSKFWLWTERFMWLIVAAACAVGQFVIAFWLSLIRQEIGKPIDEIAADDPLRLQFNAMHEYSVWLLMAAMIAALLAFFIAANRSFNPKPANNVTEFDFQKEFKI